MVLPFSRTQNIEQMHTTNGHAIILAAATASNLPPPQYSQLSIPNAGVCHTLSLSHVSLLCLLASDSPLTIHISYLKMIKVDCSIWAAIIRQIKRHKLSCWQPAIHSSLATSYYIKHKPKYLSIIRYGTWICWSHAVLSIIRGGPCIDGSQASLLYSWSL